MMQLTSKPRSSQKPFRAHRAANQYARQSRSNCCALCVPEDWTRVVVRDALQSRVTLQKHGSQQTQLTTWKLPTSQRPQLMLLLQKRTHSAQVLAAQLLQSKPGGRATTAPPNPGEIRFGLLHLRTMDQEQTLQLRMKTRHRMPAAV
jgi:hypothetical protein